MEGICLRLYYYLIEPLEYFLVPTEFEQLTSESRQLLSQMLDSGSLYRLVHESQNEG